MSKPKSTKTKKNRLFHNLRVATPLVLIPLLIGIFAIHFIFSEAFAADLGASANQKLVTPGYQSAEATLAATQATAGPQFAYYQLQEGQDLNWAAAHFSVSLTKLQAMNPGIPVAGTTIKVPPAEAPLTPVSSPGANLSDLTVTVNQGTIYVTNPFTNPEVTMNIPQLMDVLKSYGGISQIGPKQYRILKPIFIEKNIRLDITGQTVTTLQLESNPNWAITTLTFEDSEALIDNTNITSIDTTNGKPDTNYVDGRSFVRAYANSRMDVINSHISYLGMGKVQLENPPITAALPFVPLGGVYGISWRIPTGTYGKNIVTGWVQGSTFEHNYIGSFTFGASGMMWQHNLFTLNIVYGLDPHDDSDNATIEYNSFIRNGKHGFIVSKRCDYNVIKDNLSEDNKLHGFMLHKDSVYNIIEDNVAVNNQDNYVIYDSSFNTIRNNKGYDPRGSQVRINATATNNFIQNNQFYGGATGVYLYANTNNTLISGNTFNKVRNLLVTNHASNVVYTGNTSEKVGYKIDNSTDIAFGVNYINKRRLINLSPLGSKDAFLPRI